MRGALAVRRSGIVAFVMKQTRASKRAKTLCNGSCLEASYGMLGPVASSTERSAQPDSIIIVVECNLTPSRQAKGHLHLSLVMHGLTSLPPAELDRSESDDSDLSHNLDNCEVTARAIREDDEHSTRSR